jgi:pimeloyl-ACP methyl ester carboxylesterase
MQELSWTWRGQPITYSVVDPVDGPPPGRAVLCIHGFGANRRHWRHNLQALAQGCRVYAIDLLGFGDSGKPISRLSGEPAPAGSVPYGFDLWAEQVVDFCQEVIGLAPASPGSDGLPAATAAAAIAIQTVPAAQLQMIGNSIGAVVALNAARLLIEQGLPPRQLLLIDCAERELDIKRLAEQPWPAQLGRPLLMALVRQRWLIGSLFAWLARPAVVRQVLQQAYPSGRNVDDELVDLLLQPAREPGARESFRGFVNLFDDWLAPQLLELLSDRKPTLPVRLLWGERDPWEPLAEAQRWRRDYTCVQELRVLPEVGHCPHDEAPELVNPILQSWLQQGWDDSVAIHSTNQS